MEKKYYDIIVSIIKENDKFAGCEPILEDIVQDVYEHSKIVLGSVTNEDVINAYLNKVVATSLITVPKKLNFNTKNKHRVINSIREITNIDVKPVENISIVESETISENIIEPDLMNLTVEPMMQTIEASDDMVEEEIETITFEQTFSEPVETELSFSEFNSENTIETSIEETLQPEALTFETEDSVELESIPDVNPMLEQDEDILEDSSLEFVESIVEEDTNLEQPFVNEESVSLEENLVENPEEELEEEDLPVQEVNKVLVDKMINGVAEEKEIIDEEIVSLEETDEISDFQINFDNDDEIILAEDDSEEFAIEEDEILELTSEDTLIDTVPAELEENNQEIINQDVISSIEEIELPKYDCFSFEPETPEFAADEICSDLQSYSTKHPDKKLLEVCKLKYEDNLSINEIAKTLDFSEETVLEVLSDIIELVKD